MSAVRVCRLVVLPHHAGEPAVITQALCRRLQALAEAHSVACPARAPLEHIGRCRACNHLTPRRAAGQLSREAQCNSTLACLRMLNSLLPDQSTRTTNTLQNRNRHVNTGMKRAPSAACRATQSLHTPSCPACLRALIQQQAHAACS